jgi:cell division protein FtsW
MRSRVAAGTQTAEYKLLLSATLCLLAFGAVMVFSASAPTSLLGGSGDSAYYFKRTVLYGLAGLLLMRTLSVGGVRAVRALTPLLLVTSLALLVAVLIPGVGVQANGAHRWIGAGAFQIQPSELAKLALVLYGAHLLAAKPRTVASVRTMLPYLMVVGLSCGLVVLEPDLGTAIVAVFAVGAVLIAGGARFRHLMLIAALIALTVLIAIAVEPYRRDRLTGFLHPGADSGGSGFQAIQAQIALGSGGLFGVGLGASVQKVFYLPEAHTDMIAAVIGEEIGLLGITALVGLFSIFGYAGFRIAQRARDRYGKLLAAGLTSLVLIQAVINLFAVMGLGPLTGVPLPFVSYGNSSLLVMMASAGLILNVAGGGSAAASAGTTKRRRAARLRVVDGGGASGRRKQASRGNSGDSGRRNRGTRRARDSRRRRAAG